MAYVGIEEAWREAEDRAKLALHEFYEDAGVLPFRGEVRAVAETLLRAVRPVVDGQWDSVVSNESDQAGREGRRHVWDEVDRRLRDDAASSATQEEREQLRSAIFPEADRVEITKGRLRRK